MQKDHENKGTNFLAFQNEGYMPIKHVKAYIFSLEIAQI